METTEHDFLERITKSRSTAEPSKEAPTEVDEVVNVSEDAPAKEVVEPEAQVNGEVTAEVEESEATQIETKEKETDLFYYDFDGEEVSSDQLKEWKSNGLMHADYTRKTQVVSEERKQVTLEREENEALKVKLTGQLASLEAMLSVDNVSDDALAEMREYEPEKYIEHLEKQGKRKEFLKEAKTNPKPVSNVNTQEEQAKLIKANPQWLNDGKATDAYTKDMNALSKYYTNNAMNSHKTQIPL